MLFKKITKAAFAGAILTIAFTSVMAAESSKRVSLEDLGYMIAANWKLKPCKLDKRSLELNQTCPLTAIATHPWRLRTIIRNNCFPSA
jgi:hypothetical protein